MVILSYLVNINLCYLHFVQQIILDHLGNVKYNCCCGSSGFSIQSHIALLMTCQLLTFYNLFLYNLFWTWVLYYSCVNWIFYTNKLSFSLGLKLSTSDCDFLYDGAYHLYNPLSSVLTLLNNSLYSGIFLVSLREAYIPCQAFISSLVISRRPYFLASAL